MEKCRKCEGVVAQVKEGLKCGECGNSFHILCVSNSGDKKPITRKNWKCEYCMADSSSVSSRASEHEGSRVTLLEAIAAFRSEFNDRCDQSNSKLDAMQSAINSVVSDVSLLKDQFTDIKIKCDSTATSVKQLQEHNAQLTRSVSMLQREVEDLQIQTRKNNILITGVPPTPRENVYKVLERIAGLLDIRYDRRDISVAHRLPGGRADNSRAPSIVVNFVSRSVKTEWLEARRYKKEPLLARCIHDSFPDTPVYLNEQLSAQSREVFYGARRLKKDGKLFAVWTSDGRVMARKSMTAPPFRVWDLRQLREFGFRTDDNGEDGQANK